MLGVLRQGSYESRALPVRGQCDSHISYTNTVPLEPDVHQVTQRAQQSAYE